MKKKWLVSAIILVVVLLVSAWGLVVGKHAYHLYQVRQEIKGLMQSELESISPDYAFNLVHEVSRDLNVLERNLKFFYPAFKLLGKTSTQVQPAIVYLDSLCDYALLMESKFSPLISNGLNNQVEILQLLDSVFNDREFIRQIYILSNEIPENRSALDIASLPMRFQDDFLLVDQYLPVIQLSGEVLPYLPELIGLDSAAQYLLLALNQDELRGGGGFITAMGTLTIQNLSNIDFDLQDSYQFDDLTKEYPLPPQPLQDFMLAGMWLSRDGNWSADFPTSALKVQELFHITNTNDFKGVIAFDQQAVRQVLAVTGPIQVDPEENIWVDEENVVQFMRESWGSNTDQADWWSNRKDFIGILGKAILETIIENRELKKVVEISKVAQGLIKSGHLLVYFNNQTMQSNLLQQGMANTVSPPLGDSLYWVDSNVGFNKVDSVIQRSLRYDVDLSDVLHPRGHLVMQFIHPVEKVVACEHISSYGEEIAYANMLERCYWDYWRLYLPEGSTITSVKLTSIPAEWLLSGQTWQGPLDLTSDLEGFSMAGGMMVLPTNSIQEIELTYDLPRQVIEIKDGQIHYNLTIFKQLGLNNLPVEFKIILNDEMKPVNFPDNLQIIDSIGLLNFNLTKSIEKVSFAFTTSE